MTNSIPEYFEDFPLGSRFVSGEELVTREEILAFAERYDPQRHHLDEAFAETTMFKGLSASGWHTAALSMRLMVQSFLGPQSGAAGAGIEELRWHLPVRPGDRLRVEVEIVAARASNSQPGCGVVRCKSTTFNQNNEPVQTSYSSMVVKRRPAE